MSFDSATNRYAAIIATVNAAQQQASAYTQVMEDYAVMLLVCATAKEHANVIRHLAATYGVSVEDVRRWTYIYRQTRGLDAPGRSQDRAT